MSPQFWLAVLAYLVPTFPLGYFWHLKTFKRTYDGLEIFRNDMIIPMGLGSMLLQAILFAWAFPHLMPTGSGEWARGALGFFMFFGLLSWSFMVLPVAAKYRMASVSRFFAVETAFVALQFAVVSPLVAWAYQM